MIGSGKYVASYSWEKYRLPVCLGTMKQKINEITIDVH
jgi:hypothetical protein